jgi:hypothetical protein
MKKQAFIYGMIVMLSEMTIADLLPLSLWKN